MAIHDFVAAKVRLEIKDLLADITPEKMKLGGRTLTKIVETYRDGTQDQNGLTEVNQALAKDMRDLVVVRYKQNVIARKQDPGSYRTKNPTGSGREEGRYSNNRLLDALESDTMATGDANGISFVDRDLLDSQARQWRRLQFGAGGNPGGIPERKYRIRFGKSIGETVHFGDPPRGQFNIPQSGRGGFFNERGQFYLIREDEDPDEITWISKKPTRGIGARRFLDAGFEALQLNFNKRYKAHFDRAAREAKAAARKKIR